MEIKKTTSHSITFTIEAFWDEQGGMGTDQYGESVGELHQAVHLLELAKVAKPKTDWKIIGTVKTSTN